MNAPKIPWLMAASLACFGTSCVSSSVHEAVVRDLSQVREESDRLKEERGGLKVTLAARDDQIRDLRQQIVTFQTKGELQDQEKEQIIQRNIDLSSELANLTRRNRDHLETIQSLRHQLEGLLNEIAKQATIKQREADRLRSMVEEFFNELQPEIRRGDITVTQAGDRLILNLLDKALFDSGSAQIKPEGLQILNRLGRIMKSAEDKTIRIEGHTDNVPIGTRLAEKFPSNWELSVFRATSVVRYLADSIAIRPDRLSAAGLADTRPIASNESKEGRAKNRRIEIIFLPLDMPPAPAPAE